jgi:hypothetical protein
MFIKEENTRKSKSLNSTNGKLKESRNIELLSWDELTEEQQDYVIKNWQQILPDYVTECFDEAEMDIYYQDVEYLAEDYESKYNLDINTKKIYWESGSQGPYPEWNLDEIFPTVSGSVDGVDYDLTFYGRGLDPKKSYYVDIFDNETQEWETELELADLKGMPNVSESLISDIENRINGAQEFINTVWRYVNDVCTSYPDEEWIEDFLDGNPDTFDFYVKDNGNIAVFR